MFITEAKHCYEHVSNLSFLPVTFQIILLINSYNSFDPTVNSFSVFFVKHLTVQTM